MGQKWWNFSTRKNPLQFTYSKRVVDICLLFFMFSIIFCFIRRFKVFKISKVKLFIKSWKSKIFHLRLPEHNDDIKIWLFLFIQILVIETHTSHSIFKINILISPFKNKPLWKLLMLFNIWWMMGWCAVLRSNFSGKQMQSHTPKLGFQTNDVFFQKEHPWVSDVHILHSFQF